MGRKTTSGESAPTVALTLRVPASTVVKIDQLIETRAARVPRHTWLVEAVTEKLGREGDQVEGVLDIFWENWQSSSEDRIYRMRFIPFLGLGGAVASKSASGERSLSRYLIGWGFRPDDAKDWIKRLGKDKSVSIPNVMLPAEEVGPRGFRIGVGVGA